MGGREELHSAHASRVSRCSRVFPRPTCSVDDDKPLFKVWGRRGMETKRVG